MYVVFTNYSLNTFLQLVRNKYIGIKYSQIYHNFYLIKQKIYLNNKKVLSNIFLHLYTEYFY